MKHNFEELLKYFEIRKLEEKLEFQIKKWLRGRINPDDESRLVKSKIEDISIIAE